MLNRTRDDHVNSVFLRAIGALALASHELDQLRHSGAAVDDAWHEFAAHLAQGAGAVMDGAAGSSFPGNTISILRDGVHVAVDEQFIEKLTDKIRRHVRVGRALGLAETDTTDAAEAVPA
jgi:hypothetical protein